MVTHNNIKFFKGVREGLVSQDVTPVRACPELDSGDLHPLELSEVISRPKGVKIHTCYNALLLVFFDFFKSLQQVSGQFNDSPAQPFYH
jgi:hypothetical protein